MNENNKEEYSISDSISLLNQKQNGNLDDFQQIKTEIIFSETEIKNKIEAIGYSSQQLKIILLSFMTISTEAMQLSDCVYLYIPLKEYFSLSSDILLQIAIACFMIGFGIGSFLLQYIKNYLSRDILVKSSYFILILLYIFVIFIKNIVVFVIIKFFVGMTIGVITPIIVNTLCEYLPSKRRYFTLNFIWGFIFIGQLIILITIYIFMPNFELEGIRIVYIVILINIVFSFILTIMLYSDSPRNLSIENRNNEASIIIKNMFEKEHIKYTKEEIDYIILYFKSGDNQNLEKSILSLFKTGLIKMTLLLISISFIASFLRFGSFVVYIPELQQMENFNSNHMINGHIASSFIGLIFGSLISIMTEFKYIGLIKISYILYGSSIIFSLLCIFYPLKINSFLAINILLYKIAYVSLTAYSVLIYPTKIRDISSGFLYFCKRCGNITAQFLFLNLVKEYPKIPIIILLVLSIIQVILVILLPVEPNTHDLDREFELENTKSKEK